MLTADLWGLPYLDPLPFRFLPLPPGPCLGAPIGACFELEGACPSVSLGAFPNRVMQIAFRCVCGPPPVVPLFPLVSFPVTVFIGIFARGCGRCILGLRWCFAHQVSIRPSLFTLFAFSFRRQRRFSASFVSTFRLWGLRLTACGVCFPGRCFPFLRLVITIVS